MDDFWNPRTDEFEKRLAALPKVVKLATDIKKSKEVIAAGAPVVRWLDEMIGVASKVRKMIEDEKREFDRAGMQTVDLQIILVDWYGEPVSSKYAAYVHFSSLAHATSSVAAYMEGARPTTRSGQGSRS